MPNQVRVGVGVTGAKGAASELDQLRDKFDRLQKQGAKGFAIGAGAAITTAGINLVGDAVGGLISAGEDAIQKASDLNETMSKSGVVFGAASEKVSKWGDTSAEAFGLSKQKAVEAAASFGNVFKGLGFAEDQSAQMSERLVQLAGDLASFNNIDPTAALDKLKSGLAGEAEPLRSVGVFLNEATVKAKAMQMGLGNAHGELTEGEKILARYQLILEQTKTAQGDFARTSDGLANSQRKANAELENLQAEAGQKMLPVQLALTRATIDLFTGLNTLADGISGKVTPATLGLLNADHGLGAATEVAHRKIAEMDDAALAAAVSMGALSQSEVDTELASRKAAEATHYMASHVKDDVYDANAAAVRFAEGFTKAVGAAGAAGAAQVAQRDIDEAFARIRQASRKTVFALIDDKRKLIEDYFDAIKTADDLAATNAEIAANKRILASHTATTAEKRDARDAIHSLNRDRFEALADLAEHGKSSSKVYKDAVKGLLNDLKHAHGEEAVMLRKEIDLLRLLELRAQAAKTVIGQTLAKGGYVSAAGAAAALEHHASGGHYSAGVPRMVGELGPEIDVPDHSGTIIPNSQLGGTAPSVSGVLPVPVPANWTPGQQAAWAREAAPAMLRELQRQGFLRP